jgi:starch synthase (maltosyl-transferring)
MPAVHRERPELDRLSGQRRVVLERLRPEIEGGRFAIKRAQGEAIHVTVTAMADGHDLVACALKYWHERWGDWREVRMTSAGQDAWQAAFRVEEIGRYSYTAVAWVDRFRTWRRDLEKRFQAGKDVSSELLVGAEMLRAAAARAAGDASAVLLEAAQRLAGDVSSPWRVAKALESELLELMEQYAPRRHESSYLRELEVIVDRPRARYSAWYELFPRSCSSKPGQHGTLRDVINWLPYVREMGFNVLYLPPIHPIGRTHRKGRNNAAELQPGDPGSPWGIGAAEGGHKAVHPQLGTLGDFHALVSAARDHDLEIALDLAFQCSPDHPYVKQHPEWFRHRPDGTIQYAENPPKEYQDIYPFDFECDAWRELWNELRSVVLFWIEQGVNLFRVDNPHTKPFAFWEWLIGSVKGEHPQVLFLSEAFTRPQVMYELAGLGFTQSYTYFTWRNTKRELTEYFEQLARTDVREYFRPNVWPNTPDILPEYLQGGGRPAFMIRLVLAATLSANYGIYGPAFELCENRPRHSGSEEYLDSEKYEIRTWDLNSPQSLRHFIGRVNRIRDENVALQSDASLRFHPVDNERIIAYSKHAAEGSNIVLAVVNLDPGSTQAGTLDVSLDELGLKEDRPYVVTELFSGDRRIWQGRRQFVELNPQHLPARLFQLRRETRSERDFEYYL